MRCAFSFPGSFGHGHSPAGHRSTAACFALRIGGGLIGGILVQSRRPLRARRKPVSQRHRPPCRFGRAAERARCKRRCCTRTSTQDPQPMALVREWCGRRDCGSAVIPQKGSCMCHLTGGGGGSKRSANRAREGNEGNVSLEATMDSKKPNSKRETHSTDQLLLPQPQKTWAPSKSIKEVARRAVSSAISSKRILRPEHFPST